jgi:hypothetical protein
MFKALCELNLYIIFQVNVSPLAVCHGKDRPRPLSDKARVRSHSSPHGNCSVQVTRRHAFLPALVSLISTIPPTLHAHLHLYVITGRTNELSMGTFKKAVLFRKTENV